jgi:hypothetical protein
VEYKKYYNILANDQMDIELSEEDQNFFATHNLFLYYSSHAQDNQTEPEKISMHKKYILTHKLLYRKRITELTAICNALDDANIQHIVIKGISLAETYPEPFTRIMGDHDILVRYDDFFRAQVVLSDLGYSNPHHKSSYKDVTLFKKDCLNIELHHSLFNKNTDSFANLFENNIWQNREVFEIGKNQITVPTPEIHFQYMLLHTMKHFDAMGAGLRHFLDLKYFSVYHHIDLLEQYSFFNKIGYGKFYRYCISLCVHYLNTPFDNDQDFLVDKNDSILHTFSDYVAENGVFGRSGEAHRIDLRFERYKNQSAKNTSLSIFRRAIFPSRLEIESAFDYAKKNPGLLPIAWIHRLIKKITNKEFRTKEKLFLFTRNDDVIESINAMKMQVGLREKQGNEK